MGEGDGPDALEILRAIRLQQHVGPLSFSHRMGEGRDEGIFLFKVQQFFSPRHWMLVCWMFQSLCGDEPSPLLHFSLPTPHGAFYPALMIQRYSRPEMRAVWTDDNKLRMWLQVELLAGAALVKEGIVPAEDFQKLKAGAESWSGDLKGLVARQRELEQTTNHDVIAFTTAVAEKINDNASRWFHFGLTSSDVVDTAMAVQMVQSADILIADVQVLRKSIARRAREFMLTPCIGRSHGIHAEPTTFGFKLALMYDEFGRAG